MSRRARIAVIACAAILFGLFLIRVRGVLPPFAFALAVAYLSHPLVSALEAREVPRPVAILLVYAMFTVIAILAVYAVLPSLTRELEQILAFIPEQSRRLEGFGEEALSGLRRISIPAGFEDVLAIGIERAEGLIERFAVRTAEILMSLLSHVFHLILAPFLAYYLLRDVHLLERAAVSWLPSGIRKDVTELARRVNRVVGGFLRGQLIVSSLVGAAVAVGLSLLGVRYALVVGMLAALFDIIPYFGPILSAVPALALALAASPATAIWTALLLLAVQQIEGTLLSPKIVGDQVGLHPITVIFAVLAGGELAGVIGMFLAVPVVATVKVTAGYVAERMLEA